MTDKPSPATLKPCPFCGETPAKLAFEEGSTHRWWRVGCSSCAMLTEIRREARYDVNEPTEGDIKHAVEFWNTRPLDLPSSCSLSHQEIRYTGDKCPLCEAMKEVEELRAAGGALQGALCAAIFIPDGVKKLSAEMLDSLDVWKAVYSRAALSRPSEAPAPKCGCFGPCGNPECCEACNEPEPGAGEEVKQ